MAGNRRKLYRTFNLFLAFFGLGLCIAISGPTLLDLQQAVGTTTDYIACIYPSRSIGYLTGSIIGGFLFDRYNRQLLLILVLLMASATAIIPPWCRDLTVLAADFVASGTALGMLDTSANVWILDMWKQESAPFIQALHFSFGVGAVIAPLIAEPFLSEPLIFAARADSPGEFNATRSANASSQARTEGTTSNKYPDIVYAYGIVGAYILLVAVGVVVEALTDSSGTRRTGDSEGPGRTDGSESHRRNVLLLISLSAFFFCMYSGLEVAFGQYLTSFGVKSDLRLTKSTGSFLTSVYWGSYTLFRGVGIGCAKLVSVESMLLVDVSLLVVANVLLTAFGGLSVVALCAGAIALGAGVSSLFPSTFAYLENYVDVSNKLASIFMVSASFGEMVLPIVIGKYIDHFPMVLMFVNLACGLLCFLTFVGMRAVARRTGSKYDQPIGGGEAATDGKPNESDAMISK